MTYIFEIRRYKKDSYTEQEWIVWTKGSLDDCLEDFFYHKSHPISNMTASRLTWEKQEQ